MTQDVFLASNQGLPAEAGHLYAPVQSLLYAMIKTGYSVVEYPENGKNPCVASQILQCTARIYGKRRRAKFVKNTVEFLPNMVVVFVKSS